MTIITLFELSLLANVVLFLEFRHVKKRLRQYELTNGPKVLSIPAFRPCPDCAEPLWGGIAVQRILGAELVTAVASNQVKADGTLVTKQIDVRAADVEQRRGESSELGWCDLCQVLVAPPRR